MGEVQVSLCEFSHVIESAFHLLMHPRVCIELFCSKKKTQQGYYDINNVFHAGPPPMMHLQQTIMSPQQAQAQVAAHAASQQGGVLVRGQHRPQGASVTNAHTGDPAFEFDAQAQEFIRR